MQERHTIWLWGSDHNFAAKHPQGALKARRIWALTPKTPDPEFSTVRADPVEALPRSS